MFRRKRPFISLNSSAFIENLSSSEGTHARARANHARNDAQKGCVMQLNGITLKCHWDQNFGIPYFYIFAHSLWFLVTMPNFNLLGRLEVAFFGRFLSRFCGRHYWPLFRKLACERAEVTSEAHLKPSAFTWLLARESKLSSRKDFLPSVCCTTLKSSLLQQ